MPSYDELIHVSAAVETEKLTRETERKKNALDYLALAVTTFGVGYLPLAPGTWGSAVGVLIYLIFRQLESSIIFSFVPKGFQEAQIAAFVHVVVACFFFVFWHTGIFGALPAGELFQQAVVDEVIGQLLVFLFVPFDVSWKMIAAGFLLFRLFDIWKPYPIDSLQNLPSGIGVCADDILAGVYGGAVLSLLYAVSLVL
jgi:phosphatidylglycerophosphatase A